MVGIYHQFLPILLLENTFAELHRVKSLKINILWSMGNPLPNPVLRIDSNVQNRLKI